MSVSAVTEMMAVFCPKHGDVLLRERTHPDKEWTTVRDECHRCKVEWEHRFMKKTELSTIPTEKPTTTTAAATLPGASTNDDGDETKTKKKRAAIVVAKLLKRMRDNKSEDHIQALGFLALAQCTDDIKPNAKRFRNLIIRQDGVTAIVQAMKDHPKDVQVQQHGIVILYNLSYCQKLSGAFQIMEAGAVDVILAAMQEHSEIPLIQEVGQKAVSRLEKIGRRKRRRAAAAAVSASLKQPSKSKASVGKKKKKAVAFADGATKKRTEAAMNESDAQNKADEAAENATAGTSKEAASNKDDEKASDAPMEEEKKETS